MRRRGRPARPPRSRDPVVLTRQAEVREERGQDVGRGAVDVDRPAHEQRDLGLEGCVVVVEHAVEEDAAVPAALDHDAGGSVFTPVRDPHHVGGAIQQPCTTYMERTPPGAHRARQPRRALPARTGGGARRGMGRAAQRAQVGLGEAARHGEVRGGADLLDRVEDLRIPVDREGSPDRGREGALIEDVRADPVAPGRRGPVVDHLPSSSWLAPMPRLDVVRFRSSSSPPTLMVAVDDQHAPSSKRSGRLTRRAASPACIGKLRRATLESRFARTCGLAEPRSMRAERSTASASQATPFASWGSGYPSRPSRRRRGSSSPSWWASRRSRDASPGARTGRGGPRRRGRAPAGHGRRGRAGWRRPRSGGGLRNGALSANSARSTKAASRTKPSLENSRAAPHSTVPMRSTSRSALPPVVELQRDLDRALMGHRVEGAPLVEADLERAGRRELDGGRQRSPPRSSRWRGRRRRCVRRSASGRRPGRRRWRALEEPGLTALRHGDAVRQGHEPLAVMYTSSWTALRLQDAGPRPEDQTLTRARATEFVQPPGHDADLHGSVGARVEQPRRRDPRCAPPGPGAGRGPWPAGSRAGPRGGGPRSDRRRPSPPASRSRSSARPMKPSSMRIVPGKPVREPVHASGAEEGLLLEAPGADDAVALAPHRSGLGVKGHAPARGGRRPRSAPGGGRWPRGRGRARAGVEGRGRRCRRPARAP